MSAYYTYLISSLPLLNFSHAAPFSLEDFFSKCQGLISGRDFKALERSCFKEAYLLDSGNADNLSRWARFEIALRNELARARARRKKIDAQIFVHLLDAPETDITHLATMAYRSSVPLEAELILDQARWDFLETLSFGHYFDFDFLLSYVLKLKILIRWDKIKAADKEALLKQMILN